MNKLRLLPALLLLSTLAVVGCDSNDDEDDYSAILGRWEARGDVNDSDVYLNISDDEIVAHFFDDEEGTDVACFSLVTFDVASRDGNRWTLRAPDEETGEPITDVVIFRRDGDVLVSEAPDVPDGDIVRFNRSTRTDFTPLCE